MSNLFTTYVVLSITIAFVSASNLRLWW